jgi:hypothetical protein
MYKGIRKLQTNKGGKIIFVKTKRYKLNTWSIRVNRNSKDVYIISNHISFKDWHENESSQICVLHELGHIGVEFKNFTINEIAATIYGFIKYRHLLPNKPPFKSLIKFIVKNMDYFLYGNGFSPFKP